MYKIHPLSLAILIAGAISALVLGGLICHALA